MPNKVLIIGGGIAGLATGCYLQKFGFETEIFEARDTPGGLCSSWKRGSYTIDGCLRWLVGTNPEDPLYKLWNEVINMEEIHFHYHEEFFRVKDEQGKEIIAYTSLDMLQEELLRKAPADKDLVNDFVRAVRKLKSFPLKFERVPELRKWPAKFIDTLQYLPFLGILKQYGEISIAEFAQRCKDPLLARFFLYSFVSRMPLLFIMINFSWFDKKTAGYPIGGSLMFSRKFEKKYLELGGKIQYNSPVKEIMIVNSKRKARAAGVRLFDGKEHHSDITVSASDGYNTVYNMLGGRFVDERVKTYFTGFDVFPSFIQVSLGIGKDLSGYPSTVAFPLDKPFVIDPEKKLEYVFYRIFNYDPTLAPLGKTLVTCMVQTYNYKYWKQLRESDYQAYNNEKKRIADFYIEKLDSELGGIKDKLEMTDVTTPATVIRYTHNWKGSFEGWMVTKETGFNSLPKTLPGLDDFYMTGQWVEPGGGVPAVFISGRNLSHILKRKYKNH